METESHVDLGDGAEEIRTDCERFAFGSSNAGEIHCSATYRR